MDDQETAAANDEGEQMRMLPSLPPASEEGDMDDHAGQQPPAAAPAARLTAAEARVMVRPPVARPHARPPARPFARPHSHACFATDWLQ